MIYLLYRVLQWVAFPLVLVYVLWRVARRRGYADGLGERFGALAFNGTPAGGVWLHAVSVGEVVAATALVKALRERWPGTPLWVSVGTVAGREMAVQRLAAQVDGIFYAPFDYCFASRRHLRCLRPAVVVVLETEIWPNFFREVKRTGAALILANGRISDRAMGRYRRLRWFFAPVLSQVDRLLAESEFNRERFIEIGAPAALTGVCGNLKYDFTPAGPEDVAAVVRGLLERLEQPPVWIAASTMPPLGDGDVDEDDVVIEAFRRLGGRHRDLLLILVPRRPERFDIAAGKLEAADIPYLRRSGLQPGARLRLPGVLLVDTIGELSGLFSIADVVFMGGTLARRGGHNILEPAAAARPVIIGPHMENFAMIAQEFRERGAVHEIANGEGLAAAVDALLRDGGARARLGLLALELAEARRGAADRIVEAVVELESRTLRVGSPLQALRPLTWLWRGLVWLDRSLKTPATLRTPVVSVGGLAMGGSGKTPVALWLARGLAERKLRPAVLTRGYGRGSRKVLALAPGARMSPRDTGDEPQLFLRSGVCITGIGAHRAAAGRLVERDFRPDVMILDDGFQHWALERRCDIVVLDAMDPFGGGLFPAGRGRETASALARAHAIVIMRAPAGRQCEALRREIRRHNTRAAIHLARLTPKAWVLGATGRQAPLGSLEGTAFCGLGNPAAFRQSVRGERVKQFTIFPDHHAYRPEEVAVLPGPALMTTEKDWVKLEPFRLPKPVYWLSYELEVEGGAELIEQVARAAGR